MYQIIQQDGVLEDEQQYGHHGTQTTQQQAGGFAGPDGDDDDEPHDVQQDPNQVKIVIPTSRQYVFLILQEIH